MPSEKILEQKKQIVSDLADTLSSSVAGVIVDYKGITVDDDTKLRKDLREAGVKYIWRETYLSSLDMSREILEVLGTPPQTARKTVQMFRDYDDGLIERQRAIYDDEAQLIASAQ